MGGMTNDPKRKPGRPVKVTGAKAKVFYVSAEHAEWLDALPNRSAWLSEQIERVRSSVRSEPSTPVSNGQNEAAADTSSGV